MKTLILGASGLVGARLMLEIPNSVGASRSGSPLTYDLTDPIAPLIERAAPDVAIWCLRGDFALQLAAFGDLCALMRRRGGRTVLMSTANVFDGELDRPHFARDLPAPKTDYGKFKAECEKIALAHDATVLRLPLVFAARCPRVAALKTETTAAYRNLFVNVTTAAHVARETVRALSADSGVYHVGTSDTVEHAAFMERLAARLGIDAKFTYIMEETPSYQAVLPAKGSDFIVADALNEIAEEQQFLHTNE